MAEKLNHGKLIRWLRGIAERQVTASGSRATFTSDMYFDAAEAIETLQAEKIALIEAAEPIVEYLEWREKFCTGNSDDFAVFGPVKQPVTLGQLRALRDSLSSIKGGK